MSDCAPISPNTALNSVPKFRRSLYHLPKYTRIISDLLVNYFEISESRNKGRNEAELEDVNKQDLGWGGGNIKVDKEWLRHCPVKSSQEPAHTICDFPPQGA